MVCNGKKYYFWNNASYIRGFFQRKIPFENPTLKLVAYLIASHASFFSGRLWTRILRYYFYRMTFEWNLEADIYCWENGFY